MHEMRQTLSLTTMKHMNERYEPHSTTIHSLQAPSGTEIKTTVYLVVSWTPQNECQTPFEPYMTPVNTVTLAKLVTANAVECK